MVDDAAAAIDFYRRAFGAREDFRVDAPGGECCTRRSRWAARS
ncbi:VOC family protein [Streptomyces tendae]|nr:VOC family protein [Streptomyces tendae]